MLVIHSRTHTGQTNPPVPACGSLLDSLAKVGWRLACRWPGEGVVTVLDKSQQ